MNKKFYDLGQLRGAYGAGYQKGQIEKAEEFIDFPGLVNPVGKFFHSFHENGSLNWQGKIIKRTDTNTYQVQLYEWIMGAESDLVSVHASNMMGWRFYDSAHEMNDSYYKLLRK